uniref:Uncharacterized protein n=1 Tax=Cucumis melo TaxID=3656 RepID=A0A9I9EMJ5_CUCME
MSAKERDLGMSPRTLARLTGSTVPIRLGCYLASILAIAYGACLRSGEEAPDDDRQRELDDELRAKVVDELLKRRKEMIDTRKPYSQAELDEVRLNSWTNGSIIQEQ